MVRGRGVCGGSQKILGGGNSNIFYFHPYLGKIPIWVETTNQNRTLEPEKLHTFSAVKLRMWSWNCWCSRKKACLAGHPVLFLYLRLVAELLAQVFFGGMV